MRAVIICLNWRKVNSVTKIFCCYFHGVLYDVSVRYGGLEMSLDSKNIVMERVGVVSSHGVKIFRAIPVEKT